MANKDREAVQTGLDDLLGSVIKSDQRNTGRKTIDTQPDPISEEILETTNYDNMTSLIVIDQPATTDLENYDNKTNIQSDRRTTKQPHKTVRELPTDSTLNAKRREPRESTPRSAPAQKRREEAADMAKSDTMTVTLRIPAALNAWLDEYVHRSWPAKVKKQELVIEALQMLFVRRGRPGDEKLETELLPEQNK